MLLRLGFLTVVDGKYQQSDPIVTTGHGVNKHQIVNFQIAMLKKAIEAFDISRKEEQITSTSTVSISRPMFMEFVRKIRALQSDLLERAGEETSPERAFQINLNIFPLSKESESENT
jgi:uncharacterized protein (TIGR02147 family)